MINPDNFEIIDIENRDENFTDIELNEILHDHTKTITNNDELTQQLIHFCKYISYVKDETLLNGAIEYVKKNVPINLKNFDTNFKRITVKGNFSDNDLIKIKAIYFSLIVRYEIIVIKENPPQMEPPIFDFYIDLDNKLIYYNLRFVLNQIRNNFDVGFVEFTHKKPLNEAMPFYLDYISKLSNSHHRKLEVNTERILFITNAKNNYLERQQYLNNSPQPPPPPEDEQDDAGNDYLLSTIEDFLEPISKLMSADDYSILVNSLKTYFDTGAFPTLKKLITINSRPNKKAIGWILNRIFESQGKGIELPLLHFSKNNISLFKDVDFEENNYLKSNLYNYFATKTKYQSEKT